MEKFKEDFRNFIDVQPRFITYSLFRLIDFQPEAFEDFLRFCLLNKQDGRNKFMWDIV